MCVIMAVMQDRPTPEMIKKGWERNKDGGGLAWRETDDAGKVWVRWEKGLNLEDMEEAIKTLPIPFIAHFRTASVGGVRADLCHPFEVSLETSNAIEGKTENAMFFHNGDWGSWREVMLNACLRKGHPIPVGKWSDSRAMAWLMAMYGPNFIDIIDGKGISFGPTDIEFFTGNGWKEINKVWCSNDHFWGGVRITGICSEVGCNERNGLDADRKCATHRKRHPVNPANLPDESSATEAQVGQALMRMHDHKQKVVTKAEKNGSGGGQQSPTPFPQAVQLLMEAGKMKQALWVGERMHQKNSVLITKHSLKRLRKIVTGTAMSPKLEDLFPQAYHIKPPSDGLKDPRLEPVTTIH